MNDITEKQKMLQGLEYFPSDKTELKPKSFVSSLISLISMLERVVEKLFNHYSVNVAELG
jgi:hypothetical protein